MTTFYFPQDVDYKKYDQEKQWDKDLASAERMLDSGVAKVKRAGTLKYANLLGLTMDLPEYDMIPFEDRKRGFNS